MNAAWTFSTIRSAHELHAFGTPPAMIARMLKLEPARIKALLPETQSPTAARSSQAAGVGGRRVISTDGATQLLCESCRVNPARRDVPLCNNCLYAH